MLNLWIGLSKGVTGLPRLLRDLEFTAHSIEYKFQNASGGSVHPELILCSPARKYSLLLEWKSGANTSADQLSRYAGVTAEDLRTRVHVPSPAWKKHDVVVVGHSEQMNRLKIGIEAGPHPFPLIAVEDDGLSLRLNAFGLQELNEGFSPKLTCAVASAPRAFVPYDRSSPPHVIAAKVIPALLKQMHGRAGRVTAKELCADTLPTFSIMSTAQQNDVAKGVSAVLDEATKRHFRPYLKRGRATGGVRAWDIVNNPLDLTADRRSKEFQRLRRLQEKLIRDLKQGIKADEQPELAGLDEDEPEAS